MVKSESVQFKEFMTEVKHATALVSNKKYNLGQYYDHMADFFEYANMMADAEDHRMKAKKWRKEKGDK